MDHVIKSLLPTKPFHYTQYPKEQTTHPLQKKTNQQINLHTPFEPLTTETDHHQPSTTFIETNDASRKLKMKIVLPLAWVNKLNSIIISNLLRHLPRFD